VDCGACVPVCPVEAISFEADTPAEWRVFQSVNVEFFYDLGSPGGGTAVGKIHKDHPIVAGLPRQR
jgi:ferredoxin